MLFLALSALSNFHWGGLDFNKPLEATNKCDFHLILTPKLEWKLNRKRKFFMIIIAHIHIHDGTTVDALYDFSI